MAEPIVIPVESDDPIAEVLNAAAPGLTVSQYVLLAEFQDPDGEKFVYAMGDATPWGALGLMRYIEAHQELLYAPAEDEDID